MSVPMRDVLVVHPNASRRAALASALPAHRVVAVESLVDATRRMLDSAPALIIAPPNDARLFLKEVDRAAPDAVRVFICSQSDPAGLEELLQSAAEGHVFSILDDTVAGSELRRTISHMLQHRTSTALSLPSGHAARFRLDGQEYVARCLEVGNFGATFQLPIDAPLLAFFPGTALQDVRIEHEGRLVMRTGYAQVQRAQAIRGPEQPYLRLSLDWNSAMSQPPQAPTVTMDEQPEVLATLRKALRREPTFWLQLANESGLQIRLDSPSLDVVDDLAVLRGVCGAPLPATLGDVLQLSFEMGGQSYTGMGSLLDYSPDGKTLVRVPRSLVCRNWRSLPRFKPEPQHRFLISFLAPVTGQRTTRAVLDLSSGGLSFLFDASCEILPAGCLLDASLLLPEGASADCQLEIRSIQALPSSERSEGGARPYRAGVRLLSLSPVAREAIIRAFISSRCPAAMDGARVPFQDIWTLMEEARYHFHPDYPFEGGAPVVERLGDTHVRLYSTGDLGRCILYQGSQKLMGHAAGLRMHSRSWMIQQLAVRPGFHRNEPVAHELIALLVELGEQLEDIDFVRYTWRRDNRWPNRLGSWLARAMDGYGISLLRHYNYLRLSLTEGTPTAPQGLLPVREATHADRLWIETYLRSCGDVVRVLSEDLQADQMELGSLGARFQQQGLHRRRRIFVVDGDVGPLAIALSEEGTPGLSLIEVSNAFSLLVPERSHPRAREAERALLWRCVEHARERGRPSALGLVEDDEVDVLKEAGFLDHGRFAEWIFHRSMIRRWCELWRSLFERMGHTALTQEAPEPSKEEP